jgi:heptosyltransferase III
VIRGGAIGDFILTMPALRLLQEGLPACDIEVLGYPGIIDLAEAAGLAVATRSLEHRSMALLFAKGAAIDPALSAWLCGFNLVVSYLFDPDGYLRGNMERIGVKTFLDAPHRIVPGQGHAAQQLAKPLEQLALYLDDPAPRIVVADRLPPGVRIAIHPGSGSLQKNWSVAHWQRLGQELAAAGEKLALITGEAEHERGITSAVVEAWAGIDYEHWDALSLVELARRLPSCRAFLGHDSGIGHLAAACGLPCHLFFGPTDPGLWAPRNVGVVVCRSPSGSLSDLDYKVGLAAVQAMLAALRRVDL